MEQEQIQYLPVDSIETDPQVRGDIANQSVDGLAVTLADLGQLQPIRVRRDDHRWVVVDGHRRLAAARLARMATIAAIVESRPLSEPEVTLRQLISNIHQQPLQPLEKARAIDRLMKTAGWTSSEAAKRLGQSPATVSRLLALLELPEPIRAQIEQGTIPASTAYKLTLVKDAEEQAGLAQQVAQQGLTRAEVNSAVRTKRPRKSKKARTTQQPPSVSAALGDGRIVTVRGPKLDLNGLAGCLEELLAKVKSALAGNVDFSSFVKQLRTS